MTASLSRRIASPHPRWKLGATFLACALAQLTATIATAEEKLPLHRLDGAARARIFAALAGLVILGLFLVLFAIWGANFTRRYMRSGQPLPPTGRQGDDDWAAPPREPPSLRGPGDLA